MKLLVLLFALTAVTGGQAVAIREAPHPEPKFEELVRIISGFGRGVYYLMSEIIDKIEKILESGNTTAVTEQLDKIFEKIQEQKREYPPEIMEVKEIMSNLYKVNRLESLLAFESWTRPHREAFEGVTEALELYLNPVTSKALWGLEWLEENVKPTVNEMSQPFERPLDEALESLGSIVTFYNNALEENRDVLQTSLDEAAKQFQVGVETLNKHLKPYWTPFLKEYKKYDPGLRELLGGALFRPPKKD